MARLTRGSLVARPVIDEARDRPAACHGVLELGLTQVGSSGPVGSSPTPLAAVGATAGSDDDRPWPRRSTAEPRPLPQESLVRDLDRGLARLGVAIEREEPVAAVRLDTASIARASASDKSSERRTRRRVSSVPSPSVTSRRNSCRQASRADSSIGSKRCSARRASAPETRPIPRYASSDRTPASASSASSVSAYCRSGRAPGRSATSVIISARSRGSTRSPRDPREPRSLARAPPAHRRDGLGPRGEQVAEAAGPTAAASKKSARRVVTIRTRLSGPDAAARRLSSRCARSSSSSTSVKTSSSWSRTIRARRPDRGARDRPPARGRAGPLEDLQQRGRRLDGDAEQRRSNSRNGGFPAGRRSCTSAPSRDRAPRSAGTRPARTTDDFPDPDGPTTARNRAASSSSSSLPTAASSGPPGRRSPDVGLEESAESLVRVRGSPGRGRGPRRRPGTPRGTRRRPPRVGESIVRILRGRPGDRRHRRRPEARLTSRDGGQTHRRVMIEQRGQRPPGTGAPGEHLVGDDPERVDVGPGVAGPADLFGRQVGGRSRIIVPMSARATRRRARRRSR